MTIEKLPGVYYKEDVSYELSGIGSKIPIFIGVSGNLPSYSFISYNDENKTTQFGYGKVIETGVTEGGYTEVEVLSNSVDGFEGNKYYVVSDAVTDGTSIYQLYSDAGSTGTGLYVTIEKHHVTDGTQAIKYESYNKIKVPIKDGGLGTETTVTSEIDERTGKKIEVDNLVDNHLLKRIKEFYTEARLVSSGDIGVPHIYVIDVGDGEDIDVWKNAIKTAKSLHDATVEFYIGSKIKSINNTDKICIGENTELKDFISMVYYGLNDSTVNDTDDSDYGLIDCARDLDLRYAFFTVEGGYDPITKLYDYEIIDENLINLTEELRPGYSRVGLIEPLLAGKTIARICCTPNNTEPGYFTYRSVKEGTFHPRTKHDMLELQNHGIIFNRDEHINGVIYPKINLCVSTSFVETNQRPADALFHARFNSDDLLRDVFEACYSQIKNNESATNIAYLQTRINKLVNDRVTAEEMIKYNDKDKTGTKLFVAEHDANPYNIIVYGQIQPVKCTVAIEVQATIKI